MKTVYKLIIVLVLSFAQVIAPSMTGGECFAQTIGEAFYIYRNDGHFNAFFRDEVDSIAYSCYDADSTLYNDIVTQIVYTPDSTYLIPLSAIESVSFVTPETKYQPGVLAIDSLANYVLSSDDHSFVLSHTTPSSLIPNVGDKIVTTVISDVFPNGFSGEVTFIETVDDGIKVDCSEASITDLYEVYYGTTKDAIYSVSNAPRKANGKDSPGTLTISPGRIPLDLRSTISGQYKITDELSLSFTPDLAFVIEPIWKISGFVIVSPQTGVYASAVCKADYLLEERIGGAGTLSYKKDFPIPVISRAHIPVIPPFLYFYDNVGVFFRADFTIAAKWEWNQHYRQTHVFEYSSKGEQVLKRPSNEPRLISSSHSEEGLVNGTVAAGVFAELGFTLIDKKIDRVGIRGEYGLEASAQAVLYKRDFENAHRSTALYEQMRNSGFSLSKFWNVSVEAATGPWGVNWTPLHNKTELWRMSYVPEIREVKANRNNDKTCVTGSLLVSGDCLNPVEVGLTFVDEEDNILSSEFATYPGDDNGYQFDVSNVSPEKSFTVYPTIKAWNYTMLAKPTCEIDKAEFPVTLSDFKVTKSQYKKDGFSNDGLTYDYRFDVSVTATLDEDSEGIADWGYVYEDPNGRTKEISLSSHGRSYTDTNYAYFRNEPHATCRLYGYVYYNGNDKPVYGTPEDFPLDYKGDNTCPDSNHPHMIDLGLPSGTLWACCNVGAHAPEEYGDYFAWGETQSKSVYNWDTYQYYNDNTGLVNIGSDIAGTSYDAATVNWGAPWHMPTQTQIRELLGNTSSEWTTVNGIYGRKFTASNGGTIFLPAAGSRWGSDLYGVGSSGYWSSTLFESFPGHAYYLLFYSGDTLWYYGDRDYGRSVRPVR